MSRERRVRLLSAREILDIVEARRRRRDRTVAVLSLVALFVIVIATLALP